MYVFSGMCVNVHSWVCDQVVMCVTQRLGVNVVFARAFTPNWSVKLFGCPHVCISARECALECGCM